ncbi:MAG: RNA polymerase sigma-70 factor [Muribaculaceae bacterium]|nr:RNA polymerase sigma-70 factor [Muribaculaceae bacterium]
MNSPDDTKLIKELNKGSLKAFDAIYARYVKRLFAYCYQYTRSRQIAEEIVQDVFFNLWRLRERIDPQRDLAALLFTISRRRCISAFRTMVNLPVFEDYVDYANDIALSADTAHTMEYDEFRNQLLNLIERLPDTQRRIITYSRLEQRHVKEIAELMQLAEKTVINQLSLGLKTLRDELRRTLNHNL